jgi:DNA polymerase III epsilon subunit-like protein
MKLSKEILAKDWKSFEYAVVDIEGTGAQHREQEGIVDIAVVIVRNGSVSDRSYHRLLDPGIGIPVVVSRIHGIYDKDVKGRSTFEEIRPSLEEFLGQRFLVAHNAAVERRVLGFKLPPYRPEIVFDTLKMSRAIYGVEHKHGLKELIERLDLRRVLPTTEGAAKFHGALHDAMAAAQAFVHMAYENFPEGLPLQGLADMCALDWNTISDQTGGGKSTDEKRRQANFGW